MERRTFRKLMQPSAPRKDRGVFFFGGGAWRMGIRKESKRREAGREKALIKH